MKGLNPSQAHRWVECPGSVKLQQEFPERPGDDMKAKEGEASHWYASECLKGRDKPLEGAKAPNGVFLDQEMMGAAEVYTRAVGWDHWGMWPMALAVEEPIYIPGFDNMKGTPDAWFITAKNELIIYDYKYGRTPVEATMNWQMITYAMGLTDTHSFIEDIRVVVVQPRFPHHLGPIREWTFDRERLKLLGEELMESRMLAVSSEPPTKAGKHCRYCSAAHVCATLTEAAHRDPLAVIGTSHVNELKPAELGTALKIVTEIEAEIKALKTGLLAQAEQYAKEGKPGSGYLLVKAPGRSSWKKDVDPEVAMALAKTFGVDIAKPQQLLTPTQAKAEGMPEGIVDAMSERGSTLQLKPQDLEHVAMVFGKPEESG